MELLKRIIRVGLPLLFLLIAHLFISIIYVEPDLFDQYWVDLVEVIWVQILLLSVVVSYQDLTINRSLSNEQVLFVWGIPAAIIMIIFLIIFYQNPRDVSTYFVKVAPPMVLSLIAYFTANINLDIIRNSSQ